MATSYKHRPPTTRDLLFQIPGNYCCNHSQMTTSRKQQQPPFWMIVLEFPFFFKLQQVESELKICGNNAECLSS